ncbi:MAG: PAS domain S-box protein, partial [Bacteroidota bacterium]|nr:PAS domain S-box protein [Bacteroidota bacterium]
QKVHHPAHIDRVIAYAKEAWKKDVPYEITFPLRQHDGEYRWFLTRVYPVKNEEGKVVQWIGTNTDINQQLQTETALKATKEQLELTFQNVPSSIYHFDKTGRILYLNDRAAHQLGYETVEDVLAEQDVFQLRKRLDETFTVLDEKGYPLPAGSSSAAITFTTGKASEVVAQFINKKTGVSFWLLSKSSPLYDEKGELFLVLTTATDITLQKTSEQAIRQSEEKFRTLAETLPQLVWMTDEKGNYEYASSQWVEYSGLDPYAEDTWQRLVYPGDMRNMMQAWEQSLQTGNTYRTEVRLRSRAGEYRWHIVEGEPVRNEEGKILKWIGAFTDIHHQKESEQKLEALVAQRTLDLERSNEDLQQFAHVASHDLKEPVRKIKTFTSRLQDELKGNLNEKSKLYLSKIQGAADRMFTMIDGVLTYSTFNAAEQISENVELDKVIKNIETDLEVIIQEKHAFIHYKDLPAIEGSPILIYQLFYNLVNNSLKFAKAGEAPEVFITSKVMYNEGKGFTQIVIRDNGIGFEQEQAENIFNTFARLNSKDDYEGTGLGLALCKKIVERHHGAIKANGQLNKGATFTITLPLKQKEFNINSTPNL